MRSSLLTIARNRTGRGRKGYDNMFMYFGGLFTAYLPFPNKITFIVCNRMTQSSVNEIFFI